MTECHSNDERRHSNDERLQSFEWRRMTDIIRHSSWRHSSFVLCRMTSFEWRMTNVVIRLTTFVIRMTRHSMTNDVFCHSNDECLQTCLQTFVIRKTERHSNDDRRHSNDDKSFEWQTSARMSSFEWRTSAVIHADVRLQTNVCSHSFVKKH